MTERRRLPMIQPAAEADADAVPRPAWQWVAFGAGLIVAAWAGLALLVSPLGTYLLARHIGAWGTPEELRARLAASSEGTLQTIAFENLAMHLVALGVASFVGSIVVGRYGPGRVVRHAALAGAVVAMAAISAAALSGERETLGWAFAVVLPWTTLLAAAGASWGRGPGGKSQKKLVGP